MSSSSSSLLSSRESGGGQGSSSNNNRLKMNFVDVVAAATAAGDGGKNLSDADLVSGSGEARCRRRNGGGGVGSEEEESNHGEHDATIINNAGHKKSVIPVPPPMPVPPAFFEIERPIVQSIREFSNNNGTKRTENLNWCKLWPPPEAVKMSSEQAKARHLVLNEIKELQLRRQTSFKRILKLPIWGSGENRSYQIKNSPLVSGSNLAATTSSIGSNQENTSGNAAAPGATTMNSSSNGISGTSSAEPSPQKLKDSKRNEVGNVLPPHLTENRRGSTGKPVDRSQSCKLEQKKPKRGATRERRKHSDPNIPRSTTSDADSDAAIQPGISDHHPSGSSSTSSLSARSSLDSPATSMQDMAGGRAREAATSSLGGGESSSVASGQLTSSSQFPSTQSYWDSDFETEPDPPDWRHSINQEELAQLNPREKQRQDVINEFFHTEKSHVRNLKVLQGLFYRPLLDANIMSKELLEQLFPNLEEVLALHNQYNQKMKERVKAGFPIGNIGDMLCEMFDGTVGDTLVKVGAEFTKRQKWSIEELKKERARDQTVELYLREQEKRPECRRLGLQALLPVEHQRLVKYPLLLESLAKYCDKESEEFAKVKRCVERSREILGTIDQQVAEAQNVQRLAELQGSIDTSGLEKMPESAICVEYRNLDLTTYRLIYDGPLTLKLGDTKRFKTIDLHVVLLEDCIMLLQKQDDKYLLKFHTSTVGNAAVGSQGHKFCHSPVIKFSAMLVRPVATDKRAFYLLNTTQNGPQIYELVASSTADRTQWFRHITEASNAYRARDTRGRGRGLYPADPINNNGLEGSGGDRSKTEVDRLDVESALDKKGQPAGRSQSFHEQSTSSREPHPERQPSSPPEERPELSSSAKKAGETENGSRKRFQRVEILKIAEPCPLIDPSQVVVTQGEILVADPVLTPIEKIRRKDQEVARALEEKHRLVAEYYHLPFDDELNPPATPVSAGPMSAAASIDEVTSGGERDAREVLLAALVQVKSLSDLVNESLTLSEEDAVAAASVATSSRLSPSGSASTSPHQQTTTATSTSPTPTMATATGTTTTAFPRLSSLASEAIDDLPSVKLLKRLQPPTHKLIAITKSMNHHLTSLLEIIQDRDEERDRLRKEVHRMRAMLPRESAASSGSMRPSLSAAAASTGPGSRPVSFISIEESSGPETTSASERNQESEDDGASNRSPTQPHPTVSENIGEDVASVERIIETTIASQDVEANPEQPPSQIGPGNTSPTTFKVPKTETNVSSNDEPEDETSEVMVENTEDDSAV